MIKFLVPLLCLVTLAASFGDQVKHQMTTNSNLIETMQGYAMNSPVLAQNNIKTVSVNGNNIVLTTPNCQQTHLTQQQLASSPAYEQLLSRTKMELSTIESGRPQLSYPYTGAGVVRFALNGQGSSSSFNGQGITPQSFNSDTWQLIKFNPTNMWLGTRNMRNNINRIALLGDVVTFVYNNGQVEMKPTSCLNQNEVQYINQLKAELQQVEAQFEQNMQRMRYNMNQMSQNMHHNMQNFNQQMQQSMQNMNMGLRNMFGNQRYNGNMNRMNNQAMSQMQMPHAQIMQSSGYGAGAGSAASAYASGGNGAFMNSQSLSGDPIGHTQIMQSSGFGGQNEGFGNYWPFGSNNSPFGSGFPFNG